MTLQVFLLLIINDLVGNITNIYLSIICPELVAMSLKVIYLISIYSLHEYVSSTYYV
jgi:hypothetical protein